MAQQEKNTRGLATAAMHDGDPMPWGKYKGRALIHVPAVYLLWLLDQGLEHARLKQYILNNLEVLKKEAGRK